MTRSEGRTTQSTSAMTLEEAKQVVGTAMEARSIGQLRCIAMVDAGIVRATGVSTGTVKKERAVAGAGAAAF